MAECDPLDAPEPFSDVQAATEEVEALVHPAAQSRDPAEHTEREGRFTRAIVDCLRGDERVALRLAGTFSVSGREAQARQVRESASSRTSGR